MKKALKISLYVFVLSCIVALALCYVIIPERTKSAMDIVVEYLNKPLGIAFGTTVTLGLVIGVVLKLVWDRHKDTIKSDIASYKAQIESEKSKLESKKQELTLKESEIKAYLSTYSTQIDKLTDLVVKVCETSPNAKIKAIAEEIKNTQVELSQELEQKKEIVAKYSDDEIGSLLKQVEELKEKVESYEGKETTND